MLTVKQVADRLQVSTKTVYKWMTEGKLKYVRVGTRTVRIEEADLDKFLKGEGENETLNK